MVSSEVRTERPPDNPIPAARDMVAALRRYVSNGIGQTLSGRKRPFIG